MVHVVDLIVLLVSCVMDMEKVFFFSPVNARASHKGIFAIAEFQMCMKINTENDATNLQVK